MQTLEAISHARAAGVPIVVAINKCDLPRRVSPEEVRAIFSKTGLEVCAIKGENIEKLEGMIFRSIFDGLAASEENVLVSNMRHIGILKRSLDHMTICRRTLSEGFSVEFASPDLKKAYEALGELTGERFSEEVLDTIFSKFCIGK